MSSASKTLQQVSSSKHNMSAKFSESNSSMDHGISLASLSVRPPSPSLPQAFYSLKLTSKKIDDEERINIARNLRRMKRRLFLETVERREQSIVRERVWSADSRDHFEKVSLQSSTRGRVWSVETPDSFVSTDSE